MQEVHSSSALQKFEVSLPLVGELSMYLFLFESMGFPSADLWLNRVHYNHHHYYFIPKETQSFNLPKDNMEFLLVLGIFFVNNCAYKLYTA